MVTIGAVLAMVSRSTIGKIAAMWLPIMTFFALGFEHSVVNMFLIPSGMMLGAPISALQAFFWNLLPVTVGNLFAGAVLTGMALYVTYPTEKIAAAELISIPVAAQSERQAPFAATAGLQ
jgi:formate/nitrite transporter FocA (FNT family)